MKIMLVVPTHHYTKEYPSFLSVSDFPQGYAYIAATLKKAGHEVIGLNLNNITGYRNAYEMVLTEIHPGVSIQKVKENTGWDIKVSRKLIPTVPPSEEELRIIREELDPERIHLG